ncbi:MAG: hypothetical protein ACKOSQ_08390 [Planctomycetaceae bacterium]
MSNRVAAGSALEVTAGFGGRYRAGSWTPLVVSGARPGDLLHVAVQDPDGEFVRSPPARVDEATGTARASVRVGRPVPVVRVENASTGAVAEVALPAPLPATREVLLLLGDLPAVGRATRLLAPADTTPAAVIGLAGDSGTGACAAGASPRDFDGIDLVVACGRALGDVDAEVLAGIDAWVRDGGRLVFAAGASAGACADRGGPAAAWLPGPVADLVPLRRVGAIETHARAPGLAGRPATADLRVPALANRATLAGAIDVFEGNAPTDLPLVVRRAHGLGTITWIGLDLDAEPFRGWPGTDTLLARLLGGRPGDAEAARPVGAAGPPDLAGQLRLALEAPGPGGGLAPVPFAVIAGLGLLYVACVFPLDWWLVSRSGRPWLAWLSLPALVAAVTAAGWATSAAGRPGAGRGHESAELADRDAAEGAIRGRSWLAVWRRDNDAVDVAVAGQGGDAAVSWLADAGPGFGAIDAAVAHPTLAAADYTYGATLAALDRVPVAAVASRLFEARWSGTAGGTVTSDVVRDAQGTLRGSFAHHLPFTLKGCRLAHGGWLYDVGDLAPDERHDLAGGRGPRSLAGALARREAVKEREGAARWDRAGTDLARILEVAGFHAAAGGGGYTGLEPGRLARLDLSPLLPLDRAVLVGTASDPPPGWTTPWRVADAGPAGSPEAPPCAARVYRIVIPLEAPPPVPRAAGAAPE